MSTRSGDLRASYRLCRKPGRRQRRCEFNINGVPPRRQRDHLGRERNSVNSELGPSGRGKRGTVIRSRRGRCGAYGSRLAQQRRVRCYPACAMACEQLSIFTIFCPVRSVTSRRHQHKDRRSVTRSCSDARVRVRREQVVRRCRRNVLDDGRGDDTRPPRMRRADLVASRAGRPWSGVAIFERANPWFRNGEQGRVGRMVATRAPVGDRRLGRSWMTRSSTWVTGLLIP